MPKKVFELAKELGMGPLDLVEDLKSKGITVRNHMSTLSDEDLAKIEQMRQAQESATEEKPKKTTKRKTAAKTTSKTAGVKKRIVVRRKSQEESAPKADETPVETPAVPEVAAETTVPSEGPAPAAAESETAAPEPKTVAKDKIEIRDSLPPMRGLRVVSMPDEKDKKKAEEAKEEKHSGRGNMMSDDGHEDSSSKKRVSGLAAMMGGKVKMVGRAQHLTQKRADEELKNYAALTSIGRPLYTQVRKKKSYLGPTAQTIITEMKDAKKVIELDKGTLLGDLAPKLKVKFADLADRVLDLNLLIKEDDYVGIYLANEIAQLYGHKVKDVSFNEAKVLGKDKKESGDQKAAANLPSRPPVVVIMGHVDHGKTTLLDYIRKAKVAAGEAGGITQHIGAYQVKVKDKLITFLDTPGHAAFSNIRQRGAKATDIAVLVVAADDGVMPQTVESIRFCQQAGVPIIVAVNKIDKENVNPERVKQQLTEYNLVAEEWGGDVQFVPLSALTGQGVDNLLESILLQAEMLELKASHKGNAEGVIIEAKLENGRGPVVTALIQTGTLQKGDGLVVGETFGRARSLTDFMGRDIKSAGPSTPVQILGLEKVPFPGEILNVVKNEREAKKIVDHRILERKEAVNQPAKKVVSLEDFFASNQNTEDKLKTLSLIVRSDVQGSYEAIKSAAEALGNDEVNTRVIGGGVGPINDNDVNLAVSAKAVILGFNMRPSTSARRLAEARGIEIRTYSIIYELLDDVKKALEGLLEPVKREHYIGRVEVRETFNLPKVGTIAGCLAVDGKIQRGCQVRLLRDGKIIYDGKLASLKRFKDDVKEVTTGFECGMALENFNDIKIGDTVEAYQIEILKRTLDAPENL